MNKKERKMKIILYSRLQFEQQQLASQYHEYHILHPEKQIKENRILDEEKEN